MHERNDANDALLLAEVLATRLCHDLSGNLNALVGAVDLLRDEPEAAEEALVLATDAATALVRRLRLLRAAWGGNGAALGVDELRTMIDGAFGHRLRIDLSRLAKSGSFAPMAARVTLNVLLLAAESLPMGGVVEIAGDPNHDLIVTITGPRAAWPAGLAMMLADPAEARRCLRATAGALAARTLQAPLTAWIAHATGLRLTFLLANETESAPPLLMALTQLH